MHDEQPWYLTVGLPSLLRGARRTFGSAIRTALEEIGCGDMPRNGAFVVGAIARGGSPLSGIVTHLGVSKQAGGQLVDTLVVRGYLDRSPDPDDRRRMTVTLTDRGRLAAGVTRQAVEDVEASLAAQVGMESVIQTRAALAALIDLGA